MKLSNELLLLDLETTASQGEDGHQENNDIIQIGAVLLDRDLKILGEFESLVRPREDVSQFITDLTGITNAAAQSAPEFYEVTDRLFRFINESGVKNIKTIRPCAWGTYFDLPILRRLYREYKVPYPFSGSGVDAKSIAFLWMSLSGRRTDKLSVEHVANVMGIAPTGAYHNALIDARTEAAIVQRVFRDLSSGTFIDGELITLTKESRSTK